MHFTRKTLIIFDIKKLGASKYIKIWNLTVTKFMVHNTTVKISAREILVKAENPESVENGSSV